MAQKKPQNEYTKLDDAIAKKSFLKNEYLMSMTFSHLLDVTQSDRTSLLNAALTCKDLLDVALDRLWERMASLLPVLKLLPALQFENDAYVCANVHVFLLDLISSSGP